MTEGRPRSGALLLWCALIWLTVALRVAWLTRFPAPPIEPVDAEGYHLLARNWLAGRGWAMTWEPPYCPVTVRTPLYALFVAGSYAMLGAEPARGVLPNLLLEALTAALVIRLGRECGGRRAATWAGLLYAFNGSTQHYLGYLLSEPLLLPLLTLALWAMRRSPRSLPWSAVAGAAWAAVLLTKPNLQYLAPLAGLWIGATAWRRRNAWRAAGLFGATCLALLAPWLWRNWRLLDRWVLSTAFDENLARVSAVATLATVADTPAIPWTETWEYLYGRIVVQAANAYPQTWEAVGFDACARERLRLLLVTREARAIIARHPWAFLSAHTWGVWQSLTETGHRQWYFWLTGRDWGATGVIDDLWERLAWSLERGAVGDALNVVWQERVVRPPLDAALLWWGLVAGRLAVWGWGWRGLRRLMRRDPAYAVWLALVIAYLVWLPGPIAYTRFYLPAIPAVVVLVALGWESAV